MGNQRNHLDLRKPCVVCGTLYGPGTRNLTQFLESRYCSLECAHELQKRQSVEDAIAGRILEDSSTGCHIWLGSKSKRHGYGQVKFRGERWLVHRLLWEDAHGPVPDGLQIDHICRNTACCNLDHLRLLTPGENTLGSDNMAAHYAKREVCDKCGGEFSTFPSGIRYCKPCRHAKMMEYQRWRRAEKKAGRSGLKQNEI